LPFTVTRIRIVRWTTPADSCDSMGRLEYGTDMGNGPTPLGPWAEEITALGQAGLAGDALLRSLTGPPGDRLLLDRAIYGPMPVPRGAAEVAVWINQAQRLTGVLQEAATA
jgi:hypothetical protein